MEWKREKADDELSKHEQWTSMSDVNVFLSQMREEEEEDRERRRKRREKEKEVRERNGICKDAQIEKEKFEGNMILLAENMYAHFHKNQQ